MELTNLLASASEVRIVLGDFGVSGFATVHTASSHKAARRLNPCGAECVQAPLLHLRQPITSRNFLHLTYGLLDAYCMNLSPVLTFTVRRRRHHGHNFLRAFQVREILHFRKVCRCRSCLMTSRYYLHLFVVETMERTLLRASSIFLEYALVRTPSNRPSPSKLGQLSRKVAASLIAKAAAATPQQVTATA